MTTTMNQDEFMMARARTRLLLEQPFFGSLAMRLKLIPDPSIETMQTNGTVLKFNPAYARSLPERQLLGVIAHEVWHCALLHPFRRGARDPMEWNIACDHAINPVLVEFGFELPPGVLNDPEFKGMYAEQIYAKRKAGEQPPMQQPEPEPEPESEEDEDGDDQPSDSDDGDGDDSTDDPTDNSTDDPTDDSTPDANDGASQQVGSTPDANQPDANQPGGSMPGCPTGEFVDGVEAGEPEAADAMTQEDWAIAAEQAAAVARASGELPGGLQRELKRSREPIVDWKSVLREFIVQSAPSDYSWTAPNRRFISSGIYLPGTINDTVGEIVAGIDTSASVSQEMLDEFAAELTSIIQEAKPERLHAVYCDARVQGSAEFTPDDDVKLEMAGGGGTRLQPVFDWVEERDIHPRVAVYLTDLESSDTPVEPDYPVLWITPAWIDHMPPFGQVIRLV